MYQDEVQILDYGRTALDPDTSWGIVWNVNEDLPILTPAYIGPILQEIGFRFTAPSNFGSRMVSMLAGVLAASCMLGWLLSRRTPPIMAFVLSLTLLIDPVFASNYRGGRVDGWAFAACLAACWLLRHALTRGAPADRHIAYVFCAGLLAGFAPFLWTNAPILWPLVALELCVLVKHQYRSARSNGRFEVLRLLGWFALGGLLAAGLATLPALPHWEIWWQGFIAVMEVQAFASVVKVWIVDLFAIKDPMIALAGLVALIYLRDWGILLALGVALIIIYQSMVYLPRVMYLLPYLIAIIASAASRVHSPEYAGRFGKLVMNRAIAAALLWSIAVTLLLRPYLALARWPATDPTQLLTELRQAIGEGPYRVYAEEWTTYAAGRELGWLQYHSGTAFRHEEYLELLQSMDFLVLREVPLWRHAIELVDDAGFEHQETIHFERSEPKVWAIAGIEHRFPAVSYHSINVYKKADSATMSEGRVESHIVDQSNF